MKFYLKILSAIVLAGFCFQTALAQPGTWTWMKGEATCPAVASEPSCMYAKPFWTDTAGNFWVYAYSDLWKYDPVVNTWSFMTGIYGDTLRIQSPMGVFNAQNSPGIRSIGTITWTTPDNLLWMYGGGGALENASLWKYSPALNEWAWMGTFMSLNYGIKGVPDTANSPGSRAESNTAWVDSLGNLWLFGGQTILGCGNDMWKYDVGTGIWTWMSGSNINEDMGSYGTMGVPSINNYPSSRWTNFFWKDDAGHFWIGLGRSFSGASHTDIWKFNPVSLEWTWMRGASNTTKDCPTLATCEINSANHPGRRFENRSTWKVSDRFILTYASETCFPNSSSFNDLWAYLPLQNNWVKLADYPVAGHYGTKGVPSSLDYPAWRTGAASFKDKNNNCWVYSGRGTKIGNTLWRYEIDYSCLNEVLSIKETQPQETITLFPNPVFNELNISLDGSIEQIRFYNSAGQLIKELDQPSQTKIDVRDFVKGVYITEIRLKGITIRKMLVKM